MEVEAVNQVVSGTLEGLLRSVVAETESTSRALFVLLLWVWWSFSSEAGVVGEEDDREERFSIPVARRNKNQATAEAKDYGDSDDEYGYEDDYGCGDDYDHDDADYPEDDGSGDEFLGGVSNEGKDDEDPGANGGGGSRDEDSDEDEDEDEDDDGDEDEDEDKKEDEDGDNREVQEISEEVKMKMTIEWKMEMKRTTP